MCETSQGELTWILINFLLYELRVIKYVIRNVSVEIIGFFGGQRNFHNDKNIKLAIAMISFLSPLPSP